MWEESPEADYRGRSRCDLQRKRFLLHGLPLINLPEGGVKRQKHQLKQRVKLHPVKRDVIDDSGVYDGTGVNDQLEIGKELGERQRLLHEKKGIVNPLSMRSY